MEREETTASAPALRRGAARGRRARIASLLLAALAAVVLAILAAPGARAGDPDLAKFLLKGGKDDLAKKLYDQAHTKLERAEKEDPDLLEAVYWQAVVAERRGDPPGALACYRRFAAAVQAKKAASKEETALLKKAQERLGALAAGETERRKIDDGFVEALMGFAQSNFVRDPVITGEALRILLDVRPDHAEAKRLLERIGEAGPSAEGAKPEEEAKPEKPALAGPPSSAASKNVKRWTDYLDGKNLGKNPGWTYEDGLLRIEKGGGSLTRPSSLESSGPKYVVELEARILEHLPGKEASVGIVFAFTEDDFFMLLMNEMSAILHRVRGSDRADVFRADLKPQGIGKWHRLAAVVQGGKVEVWLDGKKVTDHSASSRDDLAGEVGIFHQSCRAEVRTLRHGALP